MHSGCAATDITLDHIGKEPGGVGRAGIEVGGGDGWGAIGEHDAGVVNRCAGLERNAGRETKNNLDSIQ